MSFGVCIAPSCAYKMPIGKEILMMVVEAFLMVMANSMMGKLPPIAKILALSPRKELIHNSG